MPNSTVLVVDDEETIREYLSAVLQFEGYECRCFSESVAALSYLESEKKPADLMLADISMPGMGGMDLLRSVKSIKPEMPVILVSGLYELALALEALDSGADDYLRKPVRPNDVVNVVTKYLGSDTQAQEEAIQAALGDFLAERDGDPKASAHIEQIFRNLGFKRYETFQHSKRVAAYCRMFGERRGMSEEELDGLELGALLHDIGKIGIPRNVLLKPGALSEEEWDVMRAHPSIGYRLMGGHEELSRAAEVVYGHHESFDGGGYPRGLSGEDIPLWARMFSIIDTLDAITSDRPYRAASSFEAAFDEVDKMRGTQFDPELVEVFLQLPIEELKAIQAKYPDPPVE